MPPFRTKPAVGGSFKNNQYKQKKQQGQQQQQEQQQQHHEHKDEEKRQQLKQQTQQQTQQTKTNNNPLHNNHQSKQGLQQQQQHQPNVITPEISVGTAATSTTSVANITQGGFGNHRISSLHNWQNMTRTIAHYERQEQIGEGTYGQVYKAICKDTGQTVAMKKMRLHHSGYWGMPLQLVREIKILRKLYHPNLLQLIEVVTSKGVEHLDPEDPPTKKSTVGGGADPNNADNENNNNYYNDRTADAREAYKGNLFLVLEYVSHDLTGLMDISYPFTPVQIKCIFRQLLSALQYMHQNKYVHRDIKSSNILLTSHFQLKLADFGLARSLELPLLDQLESNYNYNNSSGNHDENRLDLTNKVITLWYRPPEILLGSVHYGCAVDVWSAGCILAELCLGKPLFTGKTEVEQLRLIADLLGTPSQETFQYIQSLKKKQPSGSNSSASLSSSSNAALAMKNMNDMEMTCIQSRPSKLRDKYTNKSSSSSPGLNNSNTTSNMPETAITLLEKLFEWDPRKRLSASNALEHRYFWTQPVAPSNPADLGILQVAETGHFHEFQTKQKRRQAKAVAEEVKQDALFNGATQEEAAIKFDTIYRKLMKQVAQEGFSASCTLSDTGIVVSNNNDRDKKRDNGGVVESKVAVSTNNKGDANNNDNKNNNTAKNVKTDNNSTVKRRSKSPSPNSSRRGERSNRRSSTSVTTAERTGGKEDREKKRGSKDDRDKSRSDKSREHRSSKNRPQDVNDERSLKRKNSEHGGEKDRIKTPEANSDNNRDNRNNMNDTIGDSERSSSSRKRSSKDYPDNDVDEEERRRRKRRSEKAKDASDSVSDANKDRHSKEKRRRKERSDSEERSVNNSEDDRSLDGDDDTARGSRDRRSSKKGSRRGSTSSSRRRHRSKDRSSRPGDSSSNRGGDNIGGSSSSRRHADDTSVTKDKSSTREHSRSRSPRDRGDNSRYRRGEGDYDREMMPPPSMPGHRNNASGKKHHEEWDRHYGSVGGVRRDNGGRDDMLPPGNPYGYSGQYGGGPPPPYAGGSGPPPPYFDGPPLGPPRWDKGGQPPYNDGNGPPRQRDFRDGPLHRSNRDVPTGGPVGDHPYGHHHPPPHREGGGPPHGDRYGPPPPRYDGSVPWQGDARRGSDRDGPTRNGGSGTTRPGRDGHQSGNNDSHQDRANNTNRGDEGSNKDRDRNNNKKGSSSSRGGKNKNRDYR